MADFIILLFDSISWYQLKFIVIYLFASYFYCYFEDSLVVYVNI
jgi:hypothetical protein